MQLEAVEIENFRGIRRTNVGGLCSLNVLIGRNNAGKSTFFQAIEWAFSCMREFAVLPPPDTRDEANPEQPVCVTLDIDLGSDGFGTLFPSAALDEDPRDREPNRNVTVVCRLKAGPDREEVVEPEVWWGGHFALGRWPADEAKALCEAVGPRFCWLKAERNISFDDDVSWLTELAVELSRHTSLPDGSQSIQALIDSVRALSPEFGVLGSVKPDPVGSAQVVSVESHDTNGAHFPLQALGSGNRAVLPILRQLFLTRSLVVAIEEPELHLHPSAIRALMECMCEASQNKQILVSSHSPIPLRTPARLIQATVLPDRGMKLRHLAAGDETAALRNIGARNSDVLMYDMVVFVEGPSDEGALAALFDTITQYYGLLAAEPYFYPCHGSGNLGPSALSLIRLMLGARLPFAVVVDLDRRPPDDVVDGVVDSVRKGGRLTAMEEEELRERTIPLDANGLEHALLQCPGIDQAIADVFELSVSDVQEHVLVGKGRESVGAFRRQLRARLREQGKEVAYRKAEHSVLLAKMLEAEGVTEDLRRLLKRLDALGRGTNILPRGRESALAWWSPEGCDGLELVSVDRAASGRFVSPGRDGAFSEAMIDRLAYVQAGGAEEGPAGRFLYFRAASEWPGDEEVPCHVYVLQFRRPGHRWQIEYASSDWDAEPNRWYKPQPEAAYVDDYSGDGTWSLFRFALPDAVLNKTQNGDTDFRIRTCEGAEQMVRFVAIAPQTDDAVECTVIVSDESDECLDENSAVWRPAVRHEHPNFSSNRIHAEIPWMWCSSRTSDEDGQKGCDRQFRRVFHVPEDAVVLDAIMQICADDYFEARVNGTDVSNGRQQKDPRGPAFCLPIGHALEAGANMLDLTISNREGTEGETGHQNPGAYTYRMLIITERGARSVTDARE